MPSPAAPSSFDPRRFVEAQDICREDVLRELRQGRKTTHWMWFVFPQLTALGRSATARHYGLDGKAEALAYWCHPVLGPRLAEGVGLVIDSLPKTAHQIFGSPDDLKFRSCVTLFDAVAGDSDIFKRALEAFFAGQPDPATVALISAK